MYNFQQVADKIKELEERIIALEGGKKEPEQEQPEPDKKKDS